MLLDKIWILNENDLKQRSNEKKRKGSDGTSSIKVEFERKFNDIIISTYRKAFSSLLSESKDLKNYVT